MLAARARQFPEFKARFEESGVRSSADSGFLTAAQIEMMIFKKNKTRLLKQMSELDYRQYRIRRNELEIERLFEFRAIDFASRRTLADLRVWNEKEKIFNELVGREKKLVDEKLKPVDDLEDFYKGQLLSAQSFGELESRQELLKEEIFYLTDGKTSFDFKAVRIKTPDAVLEKNLPQLKERALAAHPMIQAFEEEAKKQAMKIGLARREYLPEVSAFSNYGHDPRFSGNENQFFAGVRVNWDVWDFGAKNHEIKKEKSLLQESEIKLVNAKRKQSLKINGAVRVYRSSRVILKAYRARLEFQKDMMKRQGRRFREGRISRKEYLSARLYFLDGLLKFQEAREKALTSKAALLFRLGLKDFEEGTAS